MFRSTVFVIFFSTLVASTVSENCTITDFSEVSSVTRHCLNIVVSNLSVPAGETLAFHLRKGSVVTFQGTVTFAFKAWAGPLLEFKGEGITVQGLPDSVIDGQGSLYWDHLGDKGLKKPQLVNVVATGGSIFRNLKLLNCPHHCFFLRSCEDVTVSGVTIDVSDGDKDNFTGHNTDGFNLGPVRNIIIENSKVINQDDCVVINAGSNILVRNMDCSGGHGLSLSVSTKAVSNVTFVDSIVRKSANGIHVKTHKDGGQTVIRNITYKNITLEGITNFGINVQQDYENGEGTGIAASNIPIIDLTLKDITGDMNGTDSKPIQVICGDTGCLDWSWSEISINGNSTPSYCSNSPTGVFC